MQHLRLRIADAVTLLPTGGIAFVKHACRCLVRPARVNSCSDFDIPVSQAYTERVFSVCVDLTAGKRNRMTSGLERLFSCDWTWNTAELIQLNWTEQNCDEPVDCTELVTIVRDWEWECCWWWWHWVTITMIMISHAMYCKSVTSTW